MMIVVGAVVLAAMTVAILVPVGPAPKADLAAGVLRPAPAPAPALPEAPAPENTAPPVTSSAAPIDESPAAPAVPHFTVEAQRPTPARAGRVWFRARMTLESPRFREETDHLLTAFWDGERMRIESPGSTETDPRLDRLRLLLDIPPETAGTPKGTEILTLSDDAYSCDIFEAGATRLWVLQHPSRIVLKMKSASYERHTSRIAEETLRIQGKEYACLLVEGEDRFSQGTRRFSCWFTDEFAPGAIQTHMSMSDIVLRYNIVELGSGRPARSMPAAREGIRFASETRHNPHR
ncbi:MAG: hypothetical protein HYY16_13835 [Planctomycetes bacterium]|nr:hypothetical protein [Planctomycetota bacterium]